MYVYTGIYPLFILHIHIDTHIHVYVYRDIYNLLIHVLVCTLTAGLRSRILLVGVMPESLSQNQPSLQNELQAHTDTAAGPSMETGGPFLPNTSLLTSCRQT